MNRILVVNNLTKQFNIRRGFLNLGKVYAVNRVSFFIERSETLGLVGESGCGKSTLAKLIARLIEPTEGDVIFEGKNLISLNYSKLKDIRKYIQFIFQDPYASLNPRMRVEEIIGEPLIIYKKVIKRKDIIERVVEFLRLVGLSEKAIGKYPYEFSGGERQRIAIARALILNPKLIIADEPLSALDLSIQAQILNLLQELQEKFSLTYLFISHDLRVVEYISKRVMVMYLGKIMEIGESSSIYKHPYHPYTEALISSILTFGKRKKIIIKGEPVSSLNMPSGCVFYSRCLYAKEKCKKEEPKLIQKEDRFFACHYPLFE